MGNAMAMQDKLETIGSPGGGCGGGSGRTVMASTAVNGMLVFDEKITVSFKEWSGKLASILDQLHPGSRPVLWEIDVSSEEECTPAIHGKTFRTRTEVDRPVLPFGQRPGLDDDTEDIGLSSRQGQECGTRPRVGDVSQA